MISILGMYAVVGMLLIYIKIPFASFSSHHDVLDKPVDKKNPHLQRINSQFNARRCDGASEKNPPSSASLAVEISDIGSLLVGINEGEAFPV